MGTREIFQTLEFRNNNEDVIANGPFKCIRENAWLSEGYYFWEESIDSATYWGEKCCDNRYIVCSAKCDLNENNCLDLLGNVTHVKEFRTVIEELKYQKIITDNSTVGHVISFLRRANLFQYSACRAETGDAFGQDFYKPLGNEQIIFDNSRKKAKLKLHLVVQLCIYELDSLNFRDFEILLEKSV